MSAAPPPGGARPDIKECRRRNRARQGKARVPDVAILVNRKRLQPPSAAEGFDALYRVRASGGGFDVTTYEPPA